VLTASAHDVFEWVLAIGAIIPLVLYVGLLLSGFEVPPRASRGRPGDPPGEAPDEARRRGSPPAHRPMRTFRK
jgi:hypothetical protein